MDLTSIDYRTVEGLSKKVTARAKANGRIRRRITSEHTVVTRTVRVSNLQTHETGNWGALLRVRIQITGTIRHLNSEGALRVCIRRQVGPETRRTSPRDEREGEAQRGRLPCPPSALRASSICNDPMAPFASVRMRADMRAVTYESRDIVAPPSR